MHYYIDGYNWLFRTPKTKLSFEDKRRQFVQDLHDLVERSTCLITVVFDSSDPTRDLSTRGHYKALEIVFTPKMQTADNYILEAVQNAKKPQNISVVTLDRELQERCRMEGANILTFKEFFEIFNKKKTSADKLLEESYKKMVKESPRELSRLLMIFEKKLLEDLLDQE